MSTDVRGLVFAAAYRALTSETPERSARFAEVITAEVMQGLEEAGTVILADLPEVEYASQGLNGKVVIDGNTFPLEDYDHKDYLAHALRLLALCRYQETLSEPDPADVEALADLIRVAELGGLPDTYAGRATRLLRSGKVTVTRDGVVAGS